MVVTIWKNTFNLIQAQSHALRLGSYVAIFGVLLIAIMVGSINQIHSTELPEWVDGLFSWYKENKISEQELVTALEFLSKSDIISLETSEIQKILKTTESTKESEPEAKAVEGGPSVKFLSVSQLSANSPHTFKAFFKVFSGDNTVENILLDVQSDRETIQALAGNLGVGRSTVLTVIIKALDPSSITANVLSWDVST